MKKKKGKARKKPKMFAVYCAVKVVAYALGLCLALFTDLVNAISIIRELI
jgi:hypothetical protein